MIEEEILEEDEIRKIVREHYRQVATSKANSSCCDPTTINEIHSVNCCNPASTTGNSNQALNTSNDI